MTGKDQAERLDAVAALVDLDLAASREADAWIGVDGERCSDNEVALITTATGPERALADALRGAGGGLLAEDAASIAALLRLASGSDLAPLLRLSLREEFLDRDPQDRARTFAELFRRRIVPSLGSGARKRAEEILDYIGLWQAPLRRDLRPSSHGDRRKGDRAPGPRLPPVRAAAYRAGVPVARACQELEQFLRQLPGRLISGRLNAMRPSTRCAWRGMPQPGSAAAARAVPARSASVDDPRTSPSVTGQVLAQEVGMTANGRGQGDRPGRCEVPSDAACHRGLGHRGLHLLNAGFRQLPVQA